MKYKYSYHILFSSIAVLVLLIVLLINFKFVLSKLEVLFIGNHKTSSAMTPIDAALAGNTSTQKTLVGDNSSEIYSQSKRHLRAVWIATVENIDWPSKETSLIQDDASRIQKSKEELVALIDRADKLNFNAIYFQVSPTADALFKSDIVPWSRYLTGTFGKDPGFDPLDFAIKEAHKRNIELHAWFNPYRVSKSISQKTSLRIEKSVYNQHLDWIKVASNRYVVDPGIPEARKWVIDRVMEVVNKYDVDGVHFDDYFYCEEVTGEMNDKATYEKYNKGQFKSLGDFRRNNTYLLVKELSSKIKTSKSWMKFGISPSAIWGNKAQHPEGSNTNTTYTNYEACFADTKKWVEEELIDYITPQIYFTFEQPRAPYGELATWWSNVCKGKKVNLYIGMGLYKVNDDSDPYFKGAKAAPEFSKQLKFNMESSIISGSVLFTAHDLNDASKAEVINTIKEVWTPKVLVPLMPWKKGKPPTTPTEGKIKEQSGGVRLTWKDKDVTTTYFAIYRLSKEDKAEKPEFARLIGTVRKINQATHEFIDTENKSLDKFFYVVTALDRLHNESKVLVIN